MSACCFCEAFICTSFGSNMVPSCVAVSCGTKRARHHFEASHAAPAGLAPARLLCSEHGSRWSVARQKINLPRHGRTLSSGAWRATDHAPRPDRSLCQPRCPAPVVWISVVHACYVKFGTRKARASSVGKQAGGGVINVLGFL